MTIQAGGTWEAQASVSDFRLGADTVTNGGTVLAGGGTVMNGLETFSNNGLLNLTGGLFSLPDTTSLTSSGTILAINGAATISAGSPLLNSGTIDLLDGVPNDTLTIDTDFVGSGASTLQIDSSSTLTDLLVITGAASGSTDVDVNFLGGFNPAGVLVVDTGTSTVDAFVLDDVTASPLVDLSLVRIGDDFFLVSNPNEEGFAPLAVSTLALSLWYQSADEVIANLRIPTAYEGIGFWGQAYGSTDKMGENDQQIIDGEPFDADNKLKTDRYGVEGGIDYGFGMARVGLMGGYGWANANSDIGGGIDAKGWNVGLYGQYGGFTGLHAEAFVKTDKYKVDFDIGAFDSLSPDVRSTGVDGEVGYRFPISGGIVLDPNVGVSHVWTKIDDIEAFGATYDYDKLTSTRGRLGVRANFPGKWIPYLDGTVYREFEGDGEIALFDGLNTFDLESAGKGTWVRVEAGLGGWPSHGPMFAVWGEAGDRKGVGIRGGFRFGGPRHVEEPPLPAPVVAAPPPPPAATQTCPDGSVILATDACPPPPPPAPPPPAPERG
jgi:outer membrane autotransporter protein